MDETPIMQYEDLLIEIADHQIEIINELSSIHLVNMALLVMLVIIFLWFFLSKLFVLKGRKI